MAKHLKSEAESIRCSGEMPRVIHENSHVLELLFLAEFTQEQYSEMRRSRLKQPNVEELIRLGIDSGVQPMTFVVELNHCLVKRDVIRVGITGRL
jgi:hypothetical protein